MRAPAGCRVWRCQACGAAFIRRARPITCPVCGAALVVVVVSATALAAGDGVKVSESVKKGVQLCLSV